MVEPKIITLIGPVDFWWHENWLSSAHKEYMSWREKVKSDLVESGHLVYQPSGAFKGAWQERAQKVNNLALSLSDVVINLTPPGIPAYGTEAEERLVRGFYQADIFHAPPGDFSQIAFLIDPLEDPYSNVHRKSYSK